MLNIKFAVLTIFMGAVKTDVPYLTKLTEYKLTYNYRSTNDYIFV